MAAEEFTEASPVPVRHVAIAVVFNPVGQGFVSSLAQPGGNITGFAANEFALATKNLELLKKIAPGVARGRPEANRTGYGRPQGGRRGEGGQFPHKNPDGSVDELRLVATGVELWR